LICVGPSRSGTDSLRQALVILGYPKVFHGYETLLPENRHQKCSISKLIRKKFENTSKNGNITFTAQEFDDELFGEYDALTDMPIALLARELIEAYPDAKVILNRRKDIDAWYDSTLKTFITVGDSRSEWLCSWFQNDLYWRQRLLFREMVPWFYRGSFLANGKWVYREHVAMVRGLVPPERLLEWGPEDGWEPLCDFLEKGVPTEVFPSGNAPPVFLERIGALNKRYRWEVWRNMTLTTGVIAAAIGTFIVWRSNGKDLSNVVRRFWNATGNSVRIAWTA
jgi:hypothetical protein